MDKVYTLQQYKRKANIVTAIQLNFEKLEFHYEKWGGSQKAKPMDWLLCNNGEAYTVDNESFMSTYVPATGVIQGVGLYSKIGRVWAVKVNHSGKIRTKEGFSDYKKDDFVVYSKKGEHDGYCMSEEKFLSMYEPA